MPMVEVIHAAPNLATREQKRVFTEETVEIFHEVIGTPHGRLRVFFYQLDWDDGIMGLLSEYEPDDSS